MRDYLQIHLVVLAWGFTAILGRWIDLPTVDLVIWRSGLAAFGFAVVALMTGQPLWADKRRAMKLMAVGCLLGWHWVMFFLSARLATVSVCLAAMPTAMLWCTLIEPLVDGSRKWSWVELIIGGIMVGAVWLIYQVELDLWWGFTVGLVGALLAALFSVLTKQMVGRLPGSVIGFYQLTGAMLGVLLVLPWMGDAGGITAPKVSDWLWLLVLAWGCTVWAYLGYIDALTKFSVFIVNVIYNMEPVYGILLALLFFGEAEKMSPGFYVGAGIILTVVLVVPWARQRKRPTLAV